MTQGDQQMLVLHNFGDTAIELPLTDAVAEGHCHPGHRRTVYAG